MSAVPSETRAGVLAQRVVLVSGAHGGLGQAASLACAQAGGAHCLLVATGNTPRADLEGIGADAVRADLADVSAVADVLTA